MQTVNQREWAVSSLIAFPSVAAVDITFGYHTVTDGVYENMIDHSLLSRINQRSL